MKKKITKKSTFRGLSFKIEGEHLEQLIESLKSGKTEVFWKQEYLEDEKTHVAIYEVRKPH